MPNMARRGRDRGHYKGYNDHDDRVGGGSQNNDGSRRVSFKNQGGGHRNRNNRNRQQGFDTKHIRSLIMSNDDIDMGGHYNQKLSSQGGPLKQRKGKRTLKYVANCFYRVEVRYGGRYEKDYLLKVLASHINPTPLIPLGCRKNNNDFVFTVTEHATAEKIMNSNRAVTLNDGWKMSVHVRPYNPVVEIDEKLTAAMKAALASRFNSATKSLDLTTFQEDPAFLSQELICPLNRSNVMNFVIELISESVPDLIALNLNKNGISGIEHLKALIDKLPHLRVLHMAHNSIREVKQFDPLKGLKLEELNLDGNILASQFNSQEDYIREIRKRFPKVMKLDGVDLPKPITFDLEEEDAGNLPKSQLSFMCDAEHGSVMAKTFIEQYYQIFDSDDRSPLVQAYHDSAHFSVMCHIGVSDSHSMFSNFIADNRNLLKFDNSIKRLKQLKIGKHSIVGALKNFPGTEHYPTTFVVDLVFFTPALIQLIVSGLFREKVKPNSGQPVKYFSRTFVIVPVGAGFCIVNEQLCLHYPTSAQVKQIMSKSKPPVPAMSALGPSSISSPVAPIMVAPVENGLSPDILAKQQMVTDLAAKSGMNLMWSEKCLNETNWNLEQALFAFIQLRDAGTIPMEAFQK